MYLIKSSGEKSSKSGHECNRSVSARSSNGNANHVLFGNETLDMPFWVFLNEKPIALSKRMYKLHYF